MLGDTVELKSVSLNATDVDGLIYVTSDHTSAAPPLKAAIDKILALDSSAYKHVSVSEVELPGKRLVFSPVPPPTDYDDVRIFAEAASAGVKRAILAGLNAPLLVLPSNQANFPRADLVTLLGALEALYVPLQLREDVPARRKKIVLSITHENQRSIDDVVKIAKILEEGRVVGRDIGGGDPERMAPPRVQEYVEKTFSDLNNITVEVINDVSTFEKEYPLFAAVNRAANVIERHRGRIIYLRYEPDGEVNESLYLVGKGITFDSGGADVKTDGHMIGMSRDKCGAAAVAGFMKIVGRLAPKGLRVVGALCLARNSIGENSYVVDEVITARCGARVRITNTDAEGRMVLSDVLCKLKEEAINDKNPQLMTIATLTGHACLTAGCYSIAIGNSVSQANGIPHELQKAGAAIGDPFEVSVLRREDLSVMAGAWEGDDVRQTAPSRTSARSPRGHQGAAAFINIASGITKHGRNSEKPLKFTHLDIAGSAGDPPGEPTAAPVLALYAKYLQKFQS